MAFAEKWAKVTRAKEFQEQVKRFIRHDVCAARTTLPLYWSFTQPVANMGEVVARSIPLHPKKHTMNTLLLTLTLATASFNAPDPLPDTHGTAYALPEHPTAPGRR